MSLQAPIIFLQQMQTSLRTLSRGNNFHKKKYLIQSPLTKDLDSLNKLDKISWIEELQYSCHLIKQQNKNKAKDILVIEDSSLTVLSIMCAKIIEGKEYIDKKSWLESITEFLEEKILCLDSVNYSGSQKVKQLICLLTLKGSRILNHLIPGVSLCDFILNVASTQGITEVYAFTRATDFNINQEMGMYIDLAQSH